MKRRTKNERLLMVVREYERRYPGPFTTDAVSVWAMSMGLVPTPGRNTVDAKEAAAWDKRFDEVAAQSV